VAAGPASGCDRLKEPDDERRRLVADTATVRDPAAEWQVVVVTGASSGIGRASARAFARQGAAVVLSARGAPGLAAVETECRADGAAETLVVQADVTDQEAVDALVRRTLERFGRIDVLVHSAAVVGYGRFEDVPARVFEGVVGTGIFGTATVARAVLPHMHARGSGTAVFLGSVIGHIVAPTMSPYVTAKWGIHGLVRTLQVESRGTGVSVCLVAPGGVNTPIYRSAANYAGHAGQPPFPVVQPERVADAIVRLPAHPRREVHVGPANRLMMFGYTLLPAVYDLAVGPLMGLMSFSRGELAPTEGNVFEPWPEVDGPRGPWRSTGPAAIAAAVSGAAAASTLAVRTARRVLSR
jgi:short-subunit dehydrogenase